MNLCSYAVLETSIRMIRLRGDFAVVLFSCMLYHESGRLGNITILVTYVGSIFYCF